jgi:DNA processing protein
MTERGHGGSPLERACDRCLASSWLLGRLAGNVDKARSRLEQVLALGDDDLLDAVGGREKARLRAEYDTVDVDVLRSRGCVAGLDAVCQCDPAYPAGLRALTAPPAVLYVAGGLDRLVGLVAEDPVAIVGSRRASPYGLDVARSLGRGLAASGITVVSGMALGVDSAAHTGALESGGPTVAVLPASPNRPYPPGRSALHRRIVAGGAVVSELGPGTDVWRWMFPARNRIIAALAAMTVVVEAGERSGALVTARLARGIGRPVGAVPGRVTTPQAAGPNGLLATGAGVVRGPQDVLDQLFGAGERTVSAARRQPPAELAPLLGAIGEGHETAVAVARAGFAPDRGLAALAALELGGFVRRGPGGRFSVIP